MSKKIVKLFSGIAATLLLAAGCGSTGAAADAKNAILVTDTGGVNDKSFNQGTNEGIIAYADASKGAWVASQAIESTGAQDYQPNLNNAASENDLVIAAGFTIQDAFIQAAKDNPDTLFAGIDIDLTGLTVTDNITSYVFAEEEAGYLAGIAAGMQTKTNKVGYIGGVDVPAVQKFGWGYIAGVQAVNPDAEIVYEYSGSFGDVALGTQLAAAMYNTGVDVIFIAAGGTGTGAISETISQRNAGKDVWAIGVDRDQYDDGLISGTTESVILTSAVKKVGAAAEAAMESVDKDTFNAGKTTHLTIKDGAVGIPDENPNLSAEIADAIAKAETDIKDGKITPPATKDAVDGKKVTGTY